MADSIDMHNIVSIYVGLKNAYGWPLVSECSGVSGINGKSTSPYALRFLLIYCARPYLNLCFSASQKCTMLDQ